MYVQCSQSFQNIDFMHFIAKNEILFKGIYTLFIAAF